MISEIKKIVRSLPVFQSIYSVFRARKSVNWVELNKGITPHDNCSTDQKVLMATSVGDYEMGVLLESCLATALQMRGASVDMLLCDSVLSACQMSKIESISPIKMANEGPTSRCGGCFNYGRAILSGSNVTLLKYSQYILASEKDEALTISKSASFDNIQTFVFNEIRVGEHAFAGALRYFARGNLEGEEYGEVILRRYLESAILTVFAVDRLLDQGNYDVVCLHHGIYVPQGLITQVCQRKNIRVVTWNPAYKKNTFVFSHDDTYHHTMISEATSRWEHFELDTHKKSEIKNYLRSRRSGINDWIWFHDTPEENLDSIKAELGCRLDRPSIGLFTNVLWDAQLHYETNAFEGMLEWVDVSIEYFSKRPDLELFIRIHPAEMRGAIPSRQHLLEEINKRHPRLADNIFIIPPESQISTYTVMDFCNAVTIFNTKTGIEIASEGIPTIVAGEAWIRNKGFSLDASSPEHYIEILSNLPFDGKMSEDDTERALKYAHHFFMRRMIPLPFIDFDSGSGKYTSNLKSATELSYGKIKGLDLICRGILEGTPFEYDEGGYLKDESVE